MLLCRCHYSLNQATEVNAPVVTHAAVNQGVNQNQGNAVINRFAKQIVINNPVRRMTQAKKDKSKQTPEERKQKKKEYMAQKRAQYKQATGDTNLDASPVAS